MKRFLSVVVVVLILVGVGWYLLDRFGSRQGLVQINKEEPGSDIRYTHRYTGAFLILDTDTRTIRLRGSDGKEYLFRIPQEMIDNRDADVVGNALGQRLIVEWNDLRTPAQVLEDYASNPALPLNEGTRLVSIRKDTR